MEKNRIKSEDRRSRGKVLINATCEIPTVKLPGYRKRQTVSLQYIKNRPETATICLDCKKVVRVTAEHLHKKVCKGSTSI